MEKWVTSFVRMSGRALLLLMLCSVSPTGWAAPAGYSTYYVPGDEANLADVFEDSNDAWGVGDRNGFTKPIRSIIGITSWADNVQIYIDHWEDGYDFDPNDPATADESCPVQSIGNTLVLTSIDVPSLNTERPNLGSDCATTVDPCSTSITANGCYYDGKDKIYVAGGAVTMNRAAMPEDVAGIQPAVVQAIAWEVYPVRPQLTTYILPFGEDLGIADFDRTEALVQATGDNTTVQIDFDGDGTYDSIDADLDGVCDGLSVTLNEGEILRVARESDGDGGTGCGTDGGLDMGAVIQASDTIQVQYVGSVPTLDIAIRGFSAFPRGLWDNQYYAPVSGHTNGAGTDIFLHNPNGSLITIDYETNSGSGSLTIGANSTVSFANTEGVVPNNTAVYLESRGGEMFWGVSSIDRGAQAYDWGYSLVPAYLLEDDFFIGWAPSNSSLPPTGGDFDAGGIFVAAAQDNIILFVDYDADGTVDSTYSLDRLDSLYLCDEDNSATCNTAGNFAPENDADMSGARIYATGLFTAAYGQNADTANDVTGFDLGYTTLPSADWMDLVLGVTKVTDKPTLGTGTGIVAKYTITVSTDTFSVEDVTVVDTLAAGWGYCTGTDAPVVGCLGPLITFPDLTTSSDAPSTVGQDLTWGSGEFTGGQLDMAANRTLTIEYYTYTTATHTTGQISISPVEASATRTVGTVLQTFRTSDKVFHLYTTAEMAVTKSSSGVDPLNPGDQFTYTVTVTNPGPIDLTNVAIYDALPEGLGYVASSSQVTLQSSYKIQATEYYLGAGDFNGTTYDLTLNADLAANYYVIIQGSDGDGTAFGTRGPDENYVSLTADPFASGDLVASGAANRISLTRQNVVDDWIGVVTVVESLVDHTGGGFTLHDVQRVAHPGASTAGTDTSATAWGSIGQVMLMGGFNGAGCDTGSTSSINSKVCHARIWPSASDTINWSRDAGGATLSTATSTVMVLEWGSDWTVQRVRVTGNNGGDGADVTGEYNTAPISSVARANTWVWGTGHTNDQGIGDAGEAVLITLGDGVNLNPNETSVAAGIEYSGNGIDFEVYALTHANLAVDYRFKADGDAANITVDVPVDNAGGTRMALGYNGQNGTGNAYPRPMFSARYTADNTVRLERRRSGQDFPTWVEGIDFSGITHTSGTRTLSTSAGGNAPSFVNASGGYSVAPGQILTLTFDAIVDDPLATGITSATNTADVTSVEFPLPVSDSATNIINNPSSASASVGNFVWFDVDGDGVFDVGEPGLANVEVTLKDQFGTPVMVTTTDASGYYGFSGISAGSGYYVQMTAGLPAGLIQSAPVGSSDDRTDPFTLTAGASYTGADLGYTSAPGTATLGDLLWSDADGDGLRDAGELGLGGITVELWLDVDGDGIFEPTGDDSTGQQTTTTTAADGSYLFTGVTASGTEDYFVYVNASQPALTGYLPTRTVIYYAANMSAGDVDLSADFSFQGAANTYSITDRVWIDDDADQDDDNPPTNNAESGISGVTVALKDLSGTVIASSSTDSDGYFTFSGVATGSYVIAITDTTGKLADHYGTTSEAVAGEFTVVGLSANIDYSAEPSEPSFGYNLTKTIGNTVFNDINGNASQDVGEPGVSGVTVELWLDVDDNGVFEPGGGDSAGQQATTTTDAGGNYLFSGLADGRYFAHIDPTQSALSGLTRTTLDTQAAVGDQLETVISGGTNDLTLDFGYRSPDNRVVGGYIWDDTDQAGDITAGESGIEGVTVDLLRGVTVISTITTLPSTEVIDGYIDIDGNGSVDASDDGALLGVTVINGALDVNNDGMISTADDGSFAGIPVIDGLLDMNGDVIVDASDDGDLIGRYQFSGLQSDTYTARITDTGGVLGDYTTTYEKTEGPLAPSYDYEEIVNVASGSVTDIHFGLYSVMTATFALIDDFQAFFEGGQVVVEWRTLSEQGTVGFHLERLVEKSDRYKRLNKRLLPGLLYSRHGGTYRYADPGARVGGTYTYRLVEVEATGNTIEYGPYTLTVGGRPTPADDVQSAIERPVPGFERVARPMSALEQERIAARHKARGKAKRQKHQRRGPMVKVQVREDGLYYLDAAELANLLKLPEPKLSKLIKRNRLRLTNHGKPVATLAAPDNAGLYFYGQAIDIPYTQDNIYWLFQGKGLPMAESDGRSPAPVTGQTFQAHVHVEIDQYAVTNLFQDPDADYWMWDYLMPNLGRDSLFFTVASPAAAGTEGTATLVVRLQGGSEAAAGQDHHALVRFNGADVGAVKWDGLAAQELTLELPLDLLNGGDNTVEIAGVLETGVPYSLFYVNEFTLSYPRSYASENNQLEVKKAGHNTLSIEGFGSEHIMALDISNPSRPRLIKKATIDGVADNYRISFRTKGNADRYLALTHEAAAVPEGLVVDMPSRLKKRRQVDYLVITSSDMMAAAHELADYRQGQGLRTMVVDIEDIYDEFSFGLKNPGAIRAFLRHAYTRYRPGPRYVVLVGEGSYDYKDNMGFGDAIIPTPLTPTPDGLFPSDNLYVDVEGYDWIPEMAVGRLPVINAEELTAYLAKLQAYEAGGGPWEGQAILAADAPDKGGDFSADSEIIGALFPANYLIDRLYQDTMPLADARQQLIDGINEGRAFVNFIGHGSIIGLGNNGLLTNSDVSALNNAERLPVLTALTCLAGHFAYPGFDAIAESLVLKPDGGAIAVWASSSLSMNERANILGRGFYEATFQDGELILGEALLKAQTNYARDGIDKYLLDTFNLIGDPATIMK